MSNKIKISLVAKGNPSVDLTLGDEVKNIVSSDTLKPVVTFIATGEKGDQGIPGTAAIADDSVTNVQILNGTITSAQIQNYTISTNDIGAYQITGAKLASNSVTTQKIANGAVTNQKLAIDSVGPEQIIDGTITKELITDGTLTGDKLDNLTISTIKLENQCVTDAKILDKTITGSSLVDDISLGGITKCKRIKVEGESPGYIYGPDNDVFYVSSRKDLILVCDSDQTSSPDVSFIKFQNAGGSDLFTVDESGNAVLNGNLNLTGNIVVSGTVDGVNVAEDVATTQAQLLKVGYITITQPVNLDTIESDVATNNSKVGITTSQADAIVANTAKTGITSQQATDITTNNAKVGITTSQADAITANTAKPDLTVDGAGSIHVNNVPTLNQSTTGNAATATALASGNQTISGDLTIDGDIILDGNQSINSLGASGSLNVNPASVLNLGTASTDSVNIGRQSSTIPVSIYTGTSTASAVFTTSTIEFNHAVTINSDLAITGTVDGRDVATDGTKLDGIATGADVTTVTANTTNADFPVVFHDSNALHDDGASDFTYNPSTNNLKIGKLTANSSGSTLAGIVSVGTQDGDDRLHIARYRDTSTIYPFAHIYAGLDGLASKCGFKIVVRNNGGTLGDGLKIDGNTKEATFFGVINGTKLNTGQGDNELYAMDQDVETTDNVTFASVTTTGDIQVSGNDIKDSAGNAAITFDGSGGTSISDLTVPNYITVNKGITVGGAGSTFAATHLSQKTILSTAQCNALHTTPVIIAPAAGANTTVIPIGGMIRVDRAATQSNSAADLNFHYSGTTGAYFNSSLYHIRRFMWNENGDRVFTITPQGFERNQNLTDDVNADLVVSVDSALTNNCFTSVTIFLIYYAIDIS